MSTTKLAEALRIGIKALTCAGSHAECQSLEVYAKEQMRAALASYEAAPAVQVVVERERVWIKRGVQSFMLAYEAETDAEREWYAGQLRSLLAAPAAPAERLALTPEWLWLQLMDWCKKRSSHPSEHNALFAIVSEARKLAAPAAPAELHSEALLYAGKARTMAAKLFNDPQASQVDAGDLLLYMARLVDELCRAAAPAAPAPIHVSVGCMKESNGRETWMVMLAPSPDTPLTEAFQVYSSASEGRARYTAADLLHHMGLGPMPDPTAFDTELPATPAAPAPLTDEQIDQVIGNSACWDGPGLGARFKKEAFARLVEQAHGIGIPASKGGA
jgi:hypothetical protein